MADQNLQKYETLGVMDSAQEAAHIENFLNNAYNIGVSSAGDKVEIDQRDAEKPYDRMTIEALRQFIKGVQRLKKRLDIHSEKP